MPRCVLTILLITVLTIAVVAPSRALEPSIGISIGIQTSVPQSAIQGRLIVSRPGDWAKFAWLSSSGIGPRWWSTMDTIVVCDPVGYGNLQEVILIVDGAKQYRAILDENVGWKVPFVSRPEHIPTGKKDRNGFPIVIQVGYDPLPANSHLFEWKIKSKDKWNKFSFFIPLFGWNSSRDTSAASQVVIQLPPIGWDCMSPYDVFTWLKGFETPWATQDQSEAAKLRMFPVPNPELPPGTRMPSQPVPTVTPTPPPTPAPAPVASAPAPVVVQPQPAPAPTLVRAGGVVRPVAPPPTTVTLWVVLVERTIGEDSKPHYFLARPEGEHQECYNVPLDPTFCPNQDVQIRRCDGTFDDAKIGTIGQGVMQLFIVVSSRHKQIDANYLHGDTIQSAEEYR